MQRMGTERLKLSDQVRQAVRDSGMSQYALSRRLGINKGSVSRFMAGKSGLAMVTLDRLADLLDLNITAGPATAAKEAKKGR